MLMLLKTMGIDRVSARRAKEVEAHPTSYTGQFLKKGLAR